MLCNKKNSKHSIKFNRGQCCGGCRRCRLIRFFVLCNSGSKVPNTVTCSKETSIHAYAHDAYMYLQTQIWSKHAAHFSWPLKHSIQEKTNTSRMSLKASSKFSTSLASMFLLQRETALMATFHTWITRAHYFMFGGGAGWFITVHIKCALFNSTGYKEMRRLWSPSLLFLALYILLLLRRRTKPQQRIFKPRTAC